MISLGDLAIVYGVLGTLTTPIVECTYALYLRRIAEPGSVLEDVVKKFCAKESWTAYIYSVLVSIILWPIMIGCLLVVVRCSRITKWLPLEE